MWFKNTQLWGEYYEDWSFRIKPKKYFRQTKNTQKVGRSGFLMLVLPRSALFYKKLEHFRVTRKVNITEKYLWFIFYLSIDFFLITIQNNCPHLFPPLINRLINCSFRDYWLVHLHLHFELEAICSTKIWRVAKL